MAQHFYNNILCAFQKKIKDIKVQEDIILEFARVLNRKGREGGGGILWFIIQGDCLPSDHQKNPLERQADTILRRYRHRALRKNETLRESFAATVAAAPVLTHPLPPHVDSATGWRRIKGKEGRGSVGYMAKRCWLPIQL